MKLARTNLTAICLLALSLLAGAVFSACAGASTAPSGPASETVTATPTPTPEPTPEPYSIENYAVDGAEDLYDLSEFVLPERLDSFLHPVSTGGYDADGAHADADTLAPDIRCAAAGLYSDHEILLVLEEGYTDYRCVILDTAAGTYRTYLQPWPRAAVGDQEAAPGGANSLRLLSVSPLVLYDTNTATLYRPGLDDPEQISCALDPQNYDAGSVGIVGEDIYLSTWNGFLYRLEEDGSQTEVWGLPEDYLYCYPVEDGVGSLLTFRTYFLSDRNVEYRVSYDPATGETTCRKPADSYATATYSSDDTICRLDLEEEKEIHLLNTADGTEKELDLPEAALQVPASLGAQYLRPSTVPVCDDTLLITRIDGESYVTALLYWETGSIGSSPSDYSPGEDFEILDVDYGGPTARAKELGETYDVSIHIGENAPTAFSTYLATNVTDPWTITLALDALETALAKYPPGYFTQLKKDMYREIRFELVGPMNPIWSDQYIGGPSAVTFEEGGIVQLAFDIEAGVDVGTVCHELTHVFDYRLENLGLLDEEAWAAMNPEGFDYFYAYIDEAGNEYQNSEDLSWTALSEEYWNGDYDSVYFIDNYAKTYPTEDRSRILEGLSDDSYVDPCFRGAHMREKAMYLMSLMREAFDTTDWPEKLSWEIALENA